MGLSVVPYHRMREVVSVEFSQYRCDAVVKTYEKRYRGQGGFSKARCVVTRGLVTELSDKSRRRFLFQLFNASCDWFAFGTLTYPADFPTDGLKVRRDRRRFGEWLRRRDVKFATMLEFQERGAPHIHFVADRFVDKNDLSRIWFEIVGSGDIKHLRAGTSISFCGRSEQAVAYMAAIYAAKKDKQKEVPVGYRNVGRFWTTSRSLVVPVKQEIVPVGSEVLSKVRVLRKVVERACKVKRVQPEREKGKRKRKVRRKSYLRNFHFGLSGFTVYKGSGLMACLLDGGD